MVAHSKESACSAGDAGGVGLILGWEDLLEEGIAAHTSSFSWRIPWTEEAGRLQAMCHKESDTAEATERSTALRTVGNHGAA